MPMQFLAAKSLPRMTGLDWLVHTMNFCVKEHPFILNVHWIKPMGSMLVSVALKFLCLLELCVVVLVAHPYVGSPLLGLCMVLVAI